MLKKEIRNALSLGMNRRFNRTTRFVEFRKKVKYGSVCLAVLDVQSVTLEWEVTFINNCLMMCSLCRC